MTMTSVLGHLNGHDFEAEYRSWKSCSPERLFDARILETVDAVHSPEPRSARLLADTSLGEGEDSEEYYAGGQKSQSFVHLDRLRPGRGAHRLRGSNCSHEREQSTTDQKSKVQQYRASV